MCQSLQCLFLALYDASSNMCCRKSSTISFHTKRAIIELNQQETKTLNNLFSFKIFQSTGLLIFSYDFMKQPIFSGTLKRAIIWRPLVYIFIVYIFVPRRRLANKSNVIYVKFERTCICLRWHYCQCVCYGTSANLYAMALVSDCLISV